MPQVQLIGAHPRVAAALAAADLSESSRLTGATATPGRCQYGTSPCGTEPAHQGPTPQSQPPTLPVPPTPRDREALEQAIIGKTTNLLLHSNRHLTCEN